MTADITTIPARTGRAVRVAAGWHVKLINTHGSQVVDTWAFGAADLREAMCVEHTRSCLEKLIPEVGDSLYTNRRRPVLTIVADTSPGVHDLLLSACDAQRYRLLGHEGYHASCVENLTVALAALGLAPPEIPSPWNVFENVAISEGERLEIQPPPAKAGDHLVLRADMDAIVVLLRLSHGHRAHKRIGSDAEGRPVSAPAALRSASAARSVSE